MRCHSKNNCPKRTRIFIVIITIIFTTGIFLLDGFIVQPSVLAEMRKNRHDDKLLENLVAKHFNEGMFILNHKTELAVFDSRLSNQSSVTTYTLGRNEFANFGFDSSWAEVEVDTDSGRILSVCYIGVPY